MAALMLPRRDDRRWCFDEEEEKEDEEEDEEDAATGNGACSDARGAELLRAFAACVASPIDSMMSARSASLSWRGLRVVELEVRAEEDEASPPLRRGWCRSPRWDIFSRRVCVTGWIPST